MAVWDEGTYTVERSCVVAEPLSVLCERVGKEIELREIEQCIKEVRMRRIEFGAALERELMEAYMSAWRPPDAPLALSDEFRRPLKIGEPTIRVEGF